MSTVTFCPEERPFAVQFGPHLRPMNDDEFFEFCQANRGLRIERTSAGEIVIMPPAGGETSNFNAKVTARLTAGAEADGTGEPFDSSAGFILPNGAERSPDFAWVVRSRWERLTRNQRQKFPPLCPDFVVEIRSPSDSLAVLKEKMREYVENGARLGWLIDPLKRRVHVYRPGVEPERFDHPTMLSADPLLPACTLDLDRLWPRP
jgi:Uma2 family endonuclease